MNQADQQAAIVETYLVRVTCLFWLVAKLITWKLWLSDRLFPLVPPFNALSHVPAPVHVALLITSLACLIILFVKPASKHLLIVLFLAEIVSCLFDQSRWQPWEYQYLFTILLFIVFRNRTDLLLPAVAFILFTTYFFSGINKLNPAFIERIWSRMVLIRFFKLSGSTSHIPFLYYLGYAIPVYETACAVGLLFKRTKNAAAILLILMHLFNLLLLGPLGINYNPSIWPWNIGMIFFLQFLFLSSRSFDSKKMVSKYLIPVVIFWGIMPACYLFGQWDGFLSSSLYSGNNRDMVICFGDSSNNNYPAQLKGYVSRDINSVCGGGKYISVTRWSMNELKAPGYPEKRVFLRLQDLLNKRYGAYHLNFYITQAGENTMPVTE